MKRVVDIASLEAAGIVSAQQAAAIRRQAASDTASLAINVFATLGVAAVVAGIIALDPGTGIMVGGGAALVLAGLLVHHRRAASFGLLSGALVLIGTLVACGALLVESRGAAPTYGYVAAILLGAGVAARQRVLAALSVFAIAGLLGSGGGYWHAVYILWVREPAYTVAVFAGFAAAALFLARHLGPRYRGLAQIFAAICVIWVNFGFWVGSLWGDRSSLHISAAAFAIGWAVALLAAAAWASRNDQRGIVNIAAVFGAIHFYTQWFERLGTRPETVIAAGATALALAFALWRYNQGNAAAA
ncbi:MAG: hypothetical protein KIT16_12095 [Rhodospirillaceae bacterium]|nr:hypothetical protein [Rhodospirillaceae bacterium]